MSVSGADFARLAREVALRFPDRDQEALNEWLAYANVDEDAFDTLIQTAISSFKDMMVETFVNEGGEHVEGEDSDGRPVDMVGVEVGGLIGSVACNLFILGYETAVEYGQRDMSHTD